MMLDRETMNFSICFALLQDTIEFRDKNFGMQQAREIFGCTLQT